MPLMRNVAAAAALGFVTTVGFGATASAATAAPVATFGGWGDHRSDDGSLVNGSDNNAGPAQACNNNVPVNVGGVQVPVSDIAAAPGMDNDGNVAGTSKNCDQASYQDNGDDNNTVVAEDSEHGTNDHDGSVVEVSDNNVGPAQACNNNVPVNVGGVQVPVSDVAGAPGMDNDGNAAGTSKNCDQASYQDNGDDNNTVVAEDSEHGTEGSKDSEDGTHDHDGSLVEVSDNNVGPFQVCNNNVPVNVLGVQVPVSDVAGVLGFDNDGNVAGTSKNCEQDSLQDN